MPERCIPTSPWWKSWGASWCTAFDTAAQQIVVLVRPAQPLVLHASAPATPAAGGIRVIDVLRGGTDAVVVEADCEQLLLPEHLVGPAALTVLIDVFRALAQCDSADPALAMLGPDSLRILRDGSTTWSPAAALLQPQHPAPDAAADPRIAAAVRMTARLMYSLEEDDVWRGHLAYIRSGLESASAELEQLAGTLTGIIEEAGADLTAARARLRASAVEAIGGAPEQPLAAAPAPAHAPAPTPSPAPAPAMDATAAVVMTAAAVPVHTAPVAPSANQGVSTLRDTSISRWSSDELGRRSRRIRGLRTALFIVPVLVLVGGFVAAVVFADRHDAASSREQVPAAAMREIAADVAEPLVSADAALEAWDATAPTSDKLRAKGRALYVAAKSGTQDAKELKTNSATEAEGLSALKAMLSAQERLGKNLEDLPLKVSEIDAVAMQEVALNAKSVATSLVAFNISMAETEQKLLAKDGFKSLPKSAEHALDRAFEKDEDRLAAKQDKRQERLQDKLKKNIDKQQDKLSEQLSDSAKANREKTSEEVESKLAEGWSKRFTPLETRGRKLIEDASAVRLDPSLNCDAKLQTKLEGLITSQQQVALEVNVSPSPTKAGLERQKDLGASLSDEMQLDQKALKEARIAMQQAAAAAGAGAVTDPRAAAGAGAAGATDPRAAAAAQAAAAGSAPGAANAQAAPAKCTPAA